MPQNSDVRNELRRVRLALVDPDPDQPRKTFDEAGIENLARSIAEDGPQQPITLRPHPTQGGRFMVITGERRFRALQRLGWESEECLIRHGLSEEEVFDAQVVENENRVNLNLIEQAKAIQKMLRRGRTWNEVSRKTGLSTGTIRNRLNLLQLDTDVQELVATGKLPQASALQLAQYKGPRGDQIRLAWDLIHGTDFALEALKLQSTEHADKVRQGKVPRKGSALLRRIMEVGWREKSLRPAMEQFFALPDAEQSALLGKLSAATLANLVTNYEQLIAAMQKMVARVKAYEATEPKPAQSASEHEERSVPKRPVLAPAPPPAPAPQKPQAVTSPRSRTVNALSRGGNSTLVQAPPQKPSRPEHPFKTPPPDRRDYGFLSRAFRALFEPGIRGGFRVNLSRERFIQKLNVAPKDADRIIGELFGVCEEAWMAPMGQNGSVAHNDFLHTLANARYDLKTPTFKDFLLVAKKADRSRDPVQIHSSFLV
jgi:ParB/RepB/Spo0J family partition protein